MAIKISGTVVIDDSRNLCNINNLTASSINAPVSGASTCMIACDNITEGSLVAGSASHCGVETIKFDPTACNFQGVCMIPCACETPWEGGCASYPYNYAVTTSCSSADGCGLHYIAAGSRCCGIAECAPCCQCGCGCPAIVAVEHISMSCSGSITRADLCLFCKPVGEPSWTCCACFASTCYFGPTIACHSGGSKVSVIFMERCNCSGSTNYNWHEHFWCYCTTNSSWSLICHCCSCWCSTQCCTGTSSRGQMIYPYVTPDNCYIMYFFGQESQVCQSCAQAGVIVHRINGTDCLIDMTLATNSSCLCCAFCDGDSIGGTNFRHTSSQGGVFPFSYGQDGWLLSHYMGYSAGGQSGPFGCCCTGKSEWWFAVKPMGNNCVCVTNMCCACDLSGINYGRRRCLGENQQGVHCSGHDACCDVGMSTSRGWDSGDCIKRVRMYWNCTDAGGEYIGGKIACFCVSGSTLCYKGMSTTGTCPCCCCCSGVFCCCMPSYIPISFCILDIYNECSAAIWCQNETNTPGYQAGPGMINRNDGFLYAHSKPVCYQCATYRYYGNYNTIQGNDKCQHLTVAWYCCECCNFCCTYWGSTCCILTCNVNNAQMLWQYCFTNDAATCFTLNCNLAVTCLSSQFSHPILVSGIMESGNCRLDRFAEFYNGDMSIVTGQRCMTTTSHCCACWGKLSPSSCYGSTINYHCLLGIAQNTASAGETACVATLGQIDRSSFSCTWFGTACTNCLEACNFQYYFCLSGSGPNSFWCLVTGTGPCLSGFSCTNFCNFRAHLVFRPFYDCNTGRIVSQLTSIGQI